MKVCILKPLMWNTNDYISPSGFESSSGYSAEKGYGHEEWNNNPNRIWRGFKVFHTEAQARLFEYSKNGNLCILMIASHSRNQYALGIATNVYDNDDEEMQLISKELNFFDNYNQLWEQSTVRNCFNDDFEKFLEHWKEDCKWIRWKCPIENYKWFERPILLDAKKISGQNKLVSMHGNYQAVLPQTIMDIVYEQIKENSFVFDWLTTGEFDYDRVNNPPVIQTNAELRKKYNRKVTNATAINSYSYWVEGRRNIEPLHAKLQAKFVKYLSDNGIEFEENSNFIDVQYRKDGRICFCELKPTENIKTKYAIRIAVGQLLEYQYFNDKEANLEIVLSTRPTIDDVNFVNSLKIKLTYFDDELETFITK
ncbi:MAG: hypothetical protein ACOXZU_08025 [Bacteroidales bacterium]|jgi:hypothetical protein|nr:hypothetical protein [Bacteroidales bacterium]